MFKKHGDPLIKGVSSSTFKKGNIAHNKKWFSDICIVDGCENKANGGLGMCNSHYMRNWRYGYPNKKLIKIKGTAFERFNYWHIKKENGCWEWTGKLDKRGYGRLVDDNGWRDMAHRWSYKHFIGEIPKGLVIHHKCHNPKCVNPEHLEITTHYDNIINKGITNASYLNAKKTHCKWGHEFTDDNIYWSKTKYNGSRVCKICHKERVKKYLQNKKIKILEEIK